MDQTVTLEHADHTHPWVAEHDGLGGTFTVPSAGIEEGWTFRIDLTATDAKGNSAAAVRRVALDYHPLRIETDPAGLRVTVDGVSLAGPAEYQAVQGARLDVSAPSPQAGDGGSWVFDSFSDGGAATHEVTFVAGLVLRATFVPDPAQSFIRGDANGDGAVDLADGVFTLVALFQGGPAWPCPDAADANDDRRTDIADAIATFAALFLDGRALPPPTGAPGPDPTPDALGCRR